jgi:RimJ/RimL family protein N-acetyltransferase
MSMNTVSVQVDGLNRAYIEPYLALFSPHIRTVLGVPSLEAERAYVEMHLALQLSGSTHFYVIMLPDDLTLIGAIEIRDPHAYRGQLYCWISEHYWGTGYFTEAMHMVAQDYFSKTGALFFNALVACDNKRSYRALKKCGFVDSGYQINNGGNNYELILRHR